MSFRAVGINSHKEYAMAQHNVIVGNDNTNFPYIVWAKDSNIKSYLLSSAYVDELRENSNLQFTDSEFKDLIKYIKTLPDGEFQAKVAEHGKRLV